MEIALAALAAAMAGALAFPLRLPEPPPPGSRAAPAPAHVRPAGAQRESGGLPPEAVAALFVPFGQSPALKEAVGPPAPKPQTPQWLHYLAFAVDARGARVYFFKDDRSGRVLMLSTARPAGEWRLVSASGGSYLLQKGGTQYLVKAGTP